MTNRQHGQVQIDAAPAPSKGRRFGVLALGAAVVAPGTILATAGTASADSVWDRVAQCESGGNWSINTGNGYYGGLQFSAGTWRAYGGAAYAATANNASKWQQIAVAQKVLRSQGPGAWPHCSRVAGLNRSNGGSSSSAGSSSNGTSQNNSTKSSRSYQRPATKSSGNYRIQPGDTLGKIAKRYGTTWRAVWKKNPQVKNPNLIFVGQYLNV